MTPHAAQDDPDDGETIYQNHLAQLLWSLTTWMRSEHMLDVTDLDGALAGGRAQDLEAWFRALVRYPREDKIDGVLYEPTELASMLQRVAQALSNNENLIPIETLDRVRQVLASTGEDRGGARYRDVAGPVAVNATRFFISGV